MGLTVEDLEESDTPFYGIIPGRGSRSLGHITVPVTFGDKGNYHSEYVRFEVASINSSYNAILSRPALAMFMAVPHHSYLVLKMPAPNGILSIKGDFKVSQECDQAALATAEDHEVEAHREEVRVLAASIQPFIPEAEPSRTSMQAAEKTKCISLGLEDPTKEVIIGVGLEPK